MTTKEEQEVKAFCRELDSWGRLAERKVDYQWPDLWIIVPLAMVLTGLAAWVAFLCWATIALIVLL